MENCLGVRFNTVTIWLKKTHYRSWSLRAWGNEMRLQEAASLNSVKNSENICQSDVKELHLDSSSDLSICHVEDIMDFLFRAGLWRYFDVRK